MQENKEYGLSAKFGFTGVYRSGLHSIGRVCDVLFSGWVVFVFWGSAHSLWSLSDLQGFKEYELIIAGNAAKRWLSRDKNKDAPVLL